MTYSDFVKKIAKESNLSITETKIIISYLIDLLRSEINKNGKISIKDFGVFKTSLHKEKISRSPANGEEIFIPPSFSILFKLSKKKEKLLNEK